MRWLGLIIAIIGAALAVHFGSAAVRQHTLIMSAQPVPATVTASRVQEYRGSKGRKRYRAMVKFEYDVNGVTYTSDRLNAAGFNVRGSARASAFVARFPPGPAQALVSSAEPDAGFLDAGYHHAPYTLFILGLGVCGVGVLMFMLTAPSREPVIVEGSTPTLWILPTGVSLRTRWLVMLTTGSVWLLLALAAGAHFLSTKRHADSDAAFWIFGGASVLGALVTLGRGSWVLFLARTFGEPRVMIDKPQPQRGAALLVVVEQPVSANAHLDAIDVTLACIESVTTGTGKSRRTQTREAWSEMHSVLSASQRDPMGDKTVVRGAASFAPAISAMPTSDKSQTEHRYDWKLSLRSHTRGPDYRAEWKVIVV